MNINNGPLQKMLLRDEYSDVEDIILVEGTFVELDKVGDGVQQVILGISPDHFLLCRRQIPNWKEDPDITSDDDVDLDVSGLELKWIAPLRYITVSAIEEFILRIACKHCRCRHFELSTTDKRGLEWYRWLERLSYLREDPYGYISDLPLRKSSKSSFTSSEFPLSSNDSSASLGTSTLTFSLGSGDPSGTDQAEDSKKTEERKTSKSKPKSKSNHPTKESSGKKTTKTEIGKVAKEKPKFKASRSAKGIFGWYSKKQKGKNSGVAPNTSTKIK